MLGNWGVFVEGFVVVSGQGDYEEGAKVLNVRIWVKDAALEYEPRCVAKTPGGGLTTYRHAGGNARMPIQSKILHWKHNEGDG